MFQTKAGKYATKQKLPHAHNILVTGVYVLFKHFTSLSFGGIGKHLLASFLVLSMSI
jgi:hypothetical protein